LGSHPGIFPLTAPGRPWLHLPFSHFFLLFYWARRWGSLAGLLFTAEGVPFTPSHAVNHGRRYRYYVERSLLIPQAAKRNKPDPQVDKCGDSFQARGWRLPAHQIEQLVLKQLSAFLKDQGTLLDAVRFKRKSPNLVSALLTHASKLADTCVEGSSASQSDIIAAHVRRIAVAQDKVTIEIEPNALAKGLLDQEAISDWEAKTHRPIVIEVPVRFRRRGVEAKLLVQHQSGSGFEPDANLIKAVICAHEWFGRIVRGEAIGIGDIASAERLCRTYVTRVLCLSFLAPETTKAILEGRQPTELTAKRLTSSALRIPLLWSDQIGVVWCLLQSSEH
jgi:site-specific DNA recombinase